MNADDAERLRGRGLDDYNMRMFRPPAS